MEGSHPTLSSSPAVRANAGSTAHAARDTGSGRDGAGARLTARCWTSPPDLDMHGGRRSGGTKRTTTNDISDVNDHDKRGSPRKLARPKLEGKRAAQTTARPPRSSTVRTRRAPERQSACMALLNEPSKAARLERRAKQVQELEQQRRIVEAEIFYHQNETDREIETRKESYDPDEPAAGLPAQPPTIHFKAEASGSRRKIRRDFEGCRYLAEGHRYPRGHGHALGQLQDSQAHARVAATNQMQEKYQQSEINHQEREVHRNPLLALLPNRAPLVWTGHGPKATGEES